MEWAGLAFTKISKAANMCNNVGNGDSEHSQRESRFCLQAGKRACRAGHQNGNSRKFTINKLTAVLTLSKSLSTGPATRQATTLIETHEQQLLKCEDNLAASTTGPIAQCIHKRHTTPSSNSAPPLFKFTLDAFTRCWGCWETCTCTLTMHALEFESRCAHRAQDIPDGMEDPVSLDKMLYVRAVAAAGCSHTVRPSIVHLHIPIPQI